MMTFGVFHIGDSGGSGSSWNTSSTAPDSSRVQSFADERVVVDHGAPPEIHEAGVLRQAVELLRADEAAGLGVSGVVTTTKSAWRSAVAGPSS